MSLSLNQLKKSKPLIYLSLGHMVSHWYVGIIMVVIPLIKQDFSLSFAEVGLIFSLRSVAGAMGNATSGIVADFVGKRTFMLIISTFGLGFCWLMIGFAQIYLLLLMLFPLASLFSNLWHAPAMSILSEAYPERRGFALGIHGGTASLGQSISPLVMGFLITYIGWRTAIKVNISPAFVMAILLVMFFPEFGTFTKKKKTEFIKLFKDQLLKNKTLLFIALISVLRSMAQVGIETFLALFLAGQMGLSPVWVGFYLSVLTFSSTFPMPLMGWLSDCIGRESILWISLAVSGISVIAITLVKPGILLITTIVLLGLFHYSLRPVIYAFALDVTPPEIGGSAISYVFAWSQGLSSLSPIIGGFLADAFGIDFALYFIAFLSLTASLIGITFKVREKQA